MSDYEEVKSSIPTVASITHGQQKCQQIALEGLNTLQVRARLRPYHFVSGEGDAAWPQLGGVLATICPADKKIIHGMTDAIMVPCSA
jgi:hypothetical protein